MQILQLIYQIDVWEYHGATSPAPHMDTVIGWNWGVCVCVCVSDAQTVAARAIFM